MLLNDSVYGLLVGCGTQDRAWPGLNPSGYSLRVVGQPPPKLAQ